MDEAPRVLVYRRLPEAVENRLRREFRPTFRHDEPGLSGSALLDRAEGCDALCPTVADSVDRKLIERVADHVKIIANYGVGYDNIDVAAAREFGIVVTNTPDVLTESTADLTLSLMLAAARRTGEGERLCRSGAWQGWQPTGGLGTDLYGKTLGVVGFGRIGRAVAGRAHRGFGMRVLTYTRGVIDDPARDRYSVEPCDTLDELLARSDFVSLHCPGTAETRHLIDRRALKRMKNSAILVNTARGDLVDESALAEVLREGGIAAAGLDVYEAEPVITPELLTLDNIVLLPHLGSATRETRTAMGMRMLDNLTAFFSTGEAPDRVA